MNKSIMKPVIPVLNSIRKVWGNRCQRILKNTIKYSWNIQSSITEISIPSNYVRAAFCLSPLLVLATTNVYAQSSTIKGKVISQNEPLQNVSVTIEGQKTGTFTNDRGEYVINGTPGQKIVFSHIGYKSLTVTLNANQLGSDNSFVVDVTLEHDDSSLLDEVVVVGFGSQKKSNLTGSVSTVSAKEIENRPVRNAAQALQGLAPGLNISQNNGSLGSNPSINIRGNGTIGSSSSAPLVLIDGSEGSLTALNPQDIESVSVLKDAGAAAIYGSRAAFGVILVTTKSGKAGETKVNYNNNFRFNQPTIMPKMMDSYTFANYVNQAEVNGNGSPHFSAEHLQRILDYQNGTLKSSTIIDPNNNRFWAEGYAYGNDNIDWFDTMYRNRAFGQEHNLSVNGGGEKTTYYLSGNFMKQQGLMAFNTDHYDRYSVAAKINSKLSSFLQLNYNARLVREDYERPAALTDSFYDDLGRQGWPTLPLYDPNGYLFSSPSPALGMRDGGQDNNTQDLIYQQVQLVLEPLKGWRTYGNFNYRTKTEFRHWDSQRLYNHDVAGDPYLYKTSSNVYEFGLKENYYNINIYSEYEKAIGDHNFKVMLGGQVEHTAYRNVGAQRDGIIIPSQPVLNLTSGTDINGNPVVPTVSGEYQKWATAGFFGRLNYSYKNKYLVEGNLRYDGSSRFRSDSRWGWFPAISAGWNVANEEFFAEAVPFINQLKLRASYGELGNQNTDAWYPTYIVQPTGTANGAWLINNARPNTASAPGLVSSLLTWESINTTNVGVDFALLSNKLSGSFEVFNRRTLNMVGPAPQLPVTLGTIVPQTNNTDLKTTGFEATLGWNDITAGGLGYNVKFLLSDYQTTITRYPNAIGSLPLYRIPTEGNPNGLPDIFLEGQKLGDIWGFETVGIAKTQEEMASHLASLPNGGQNAIGGQWDAGDIMYKDLNGDGKVDWGSSTVADPGDQRVIGNSTPRYSFGLNLGANYKNFDFSMFLQGVMKREVWQGGYYFWGATSSKWWSTGLVENLDYFRTEDNVLGENLDAYYARPIYGTSKNQQVQTRYLQNAAYIRIKNIQLGYSIPKETTGRIGIERVRVYISGENVWTGTSVAKMFDPETIEGGKNGTVYPLTKIWSAGLSITF